MCQWCFARVEQLRDEAQPQADWFVTRDTDVAPNQPDDEPLACEPTQELPAIPNVTPAQAGAHDDAPQRSEYAGQRVIGGREARAGEVRQALGDSSGQRWRTSRV